MIDTASPHVLGIVVILDSENESGEEERTKRRRSRAERAHATTETGAAEEGERLHPRPTGASDAAHASTRRCIERERGRESFLSPCLACSSFIDTRERRCLEDLDVNKDTPSSARVGQAKIHTQMQVSLPS